MLFKWQLNKKIPWVWALIVIAISATYTMFSIQYLILDSENFSKTSDMKCLLNVMIVAMGYLIMLFITNSLRAACILSHIAFLSFGFVDYFVWQFRGNEFTVGDILGAGTGLSVASKYRPSFDSHAYIVLASTVIYIFLVWNIKLRFQVRWQMMLISFLLTVCLGLFVSIEAMDTNTETWEQKGSYRNGFILNFCLGVRDCFVGQPDDYDVEEIAKLEEHYSGDGRAYLEKTGLKEEEQPTIIAIMNESFADLRVIGDFETNEEMMPFYDSMYENTMKGYALASVYGAKTPNSEWEFLTGNTMAFLPDGSVVYQQYLKKEPNSLVATLKNEGYTAVAMHPYYATGWSRNQAYPRLGFDETYFIEDFDQTKLLRDYITDRELYRKIRERFEAKEADEKLFIMSVTMQNHGGYTTDYDNFNEKIKKIGLSYNDVNQYLSLVRESDEAIEELLTYFETVDQPVEVIFFGDHQPGLNSKFYPLLNGKGLSSLSQEQLENLYTVPFFIWTNYETEAKEVEITSLNYLSTMALKRANVALPAYNQFLSDMMEAVPAVNARGFYSAREKRYKGLEGVNQEEKAWFTQYNILQYNNMFDRKNASKAFFPYIN